MTSEFVYVSATFNTWLLTGIKQQRACLRLRACFRAKSGHFEL